jgi:hypothetical protein
MYLPADTARAGGGVLALVSNDLDASVSELSTRGFQSGAIEVIQGAGRKCLITEPDGNSVSPIEISQLEGTDRDFGSAPCAEFLTQDDATAAHH